jgi:hypothetical protein
MAFRVTTFGTRSYASLSVNISLRAGQRENTRFEAVARRSAKGESDDGRQLGEYRYVNVLYQPSRWDWKE